MRQIQTMADYLDALEHALMWRRGRRECMEILEDYEGFFRAGLAEGRTEEEICRDLGSPTELIHAMAQEPRRVNPILAALQPGTVVRLLACGLLSGAMVLLIWFCWKDWWQFFNAFPIRPDILVTLLGPLGLALFLWSGTPTVKPWHQKQTRQLLLLCHLGTVFIMAVAVGLFLWASYAYVIEYPLPRFLGEDIGQIGPRLVAILHAALVLAACTFCAALWGTLQRSVWLMTAVAHSMGAVFALTWLRNVLRVLDSPGSLWPNFWYSMYPYPAGLAGALAVGLLLFIGTRGGRRR